jgi:hypothetical protein
VVSCSQERAYQGLGDLKKEGNRVPNRDARMNSSLWCPRGVLVFERHELDVAGGTSWRQKKDSAHVFSGQKSFLTRPVIPRS